MATTLEVIRKLTLRATTEGVDQAASSADKLAKSMDGVAKSSTTMEKATLSAEKSFRSFEKSVDPAARAQANLAKAARELQKAQESGLVTQSRASELMQLAIRHHNTAGSAAQKHSQALQELSNVSQGLSSNLGAVGGILARMGPVGLAIAATVGGLALGFGLAAKGALELADDMGKLSDTADTVGLSLEKLRALQLTAGDVGIDPDQLNAGLTKFVSVLGQVRDGNEGAIKSFDRLEGGLAKNVRTAKTTEEALNLVFAAMRKADTAGAALAGRELFGKSGAGIARLANATTTIEDLANNMNKLDVITGDQGKTWDDLGDRINKNMALAGRNVKAAFADPVLNALDSVAKIALEVGRAIRQAAEDMGFNIDTSSLDSFLIDLRLLNEEIAKFGTIKAVENLSDRLFGPNFTSVMSTVISTVRTVASVFIDLINIIASAVAGLASFATLDFAGVARQAASAAASFSSLQTTMAGVAKAAQDAITPTENLAEVTVEGGKTALSSSREWLSYRLMQEKIGEITPPVSREIKKLGDANAIAAGKTKQHKQEAEKLDPVLKELGQIAGQLGSALVSAFLKGDNAAKALKTTLQGVASSATGTAINKLVTGDFGGAAISGGIALGAGLLSFLFGDDEEDQKNQQEIARQQAEAAARAQSLRDALAALADEIETLDRSSRGIVEGSLRQVLDKFEEQAQSFLAAAAAAGDAGESARIAEIQFRGLNRILTEFNKQIDVAIAEFGEAGTILNARAAVKTLKNDFDSLTQDIIVFGERTGDTVGMYERLAALQREGIEGFLNMLDVSDPLSEVQQQVAALNAVATELRDTLQELNITAEEAATVVDQKLNASLAKLAGDFLDPIIREINEFVGGGWINEATDLLARIRQLTADATALGIETTHIQTLFVLAAQDIVNQNQLVGASFDALVRFLNLGEAGLHQFSAAVEDATDVIVRSAQEIASAIQDNEDRLFLAIHRSDSLSDQLARFDLAAQREREEEIRAGGQALASLERALAQERANIINDFLDEQRRAAQEAADRAREEAARVRQEQIDAARQAAEERKRIFDEAKEFIEGQVRRIKEWIANFLSGEQSPLKPSQQLATAQSFFASELAAAASGNRDALSNITSAAQNLVDATRRYYGSAPAGQQIINTLISQLQTLPSQLSPEEFIVEGLKPPIVAIPPAITPPITGAIGDQTTTLAILLNNLKLAVSTGDSQAIAIALLPLFEDLDTTMDKALSFDELKAGLGTTFSTGTLRQIFLELDGNGNGLLEKSELIKAATQGTRGEVEDNNTLLGTVTDLLGQIKTSLLLLKSIDLHVQWCDLLQQIHTNTQSIATWQAGSSHAQGGVIGGRSHGMGGVPIVAEGGEYIVNKHDTAWARPLLDAINYGHGLPMMAPANDNGVVVAIHSLERSLLRGFQAMIAAELEAAGVIAKPAQEANKLTRARRGEKKKVA